MTQSKSSEQDDPPSKMSDAQQPHQHQWWMLREPDGRMEVMANSSCAICGLTPEAVANQAAISMLLRENAELREIAEALAKNGGVEWVGGDNVCRFCGARILAGLTGLEDDTPIHTADCPVTKARALVQSS